MPLRESDIPQALTDARAWLAGRRNADRNELLLVAEVAERRLVSTADPGWAELAVDAMAGGPAVDGMRLRVRLILLAKRTVGNGGALDPRMVTDWLSRQLESQEPSDYLAGMEAMSRPPSDAASNAAWLGSVQSARRLRTLLRIAADLGSWCQTATCAPGQRHGS